MGYLKKEDVFASIKSRVQRIHGEDYTIFEAYLGTNPFTKKPVRKSAKSKEKLRSIITEFYKRLSSGGEAAVLLDAYQSVDARNALDLLAKAKLSISLTECVRRVIDDPGASAQCSTTVQEAYAAYCKSQSDRSMDHQKTIFKRVGKWVVKFGGDRLLSDVTAKELSSYLESTFITTGDTKEKTTYNGVLNYIKSFLRWCTLPEQGYIRSNPIATMQAKVKGYVEPKYMRPDEVERLFRALEQKKGPDLAHAVLSFFCGMRQDEIKRVPLGESAVVIDIDEKYIRVIKCKGSTRGIKPRAFTIPDQALAWMRSMPDFVGAARTPNKYFRDHLLDIARNIKLPLPENAGRHTFCTMFEAAHHDANALSAIVGNTEDIRDQHYNGVAKPQDGRDYFQIMPSPCAAPSEERT